MAALYSPGSVSYYRNKNSWKEVMDEVPMHKPDSFMYIPEFAEFSPGFNVGSFDATNIIIAAFNKEDMTKFI